MKTLILTFSFFLFSIGLYSQDNEHGDAINLFQTTQSSESNNSLVSDLVTLPAGDEIEGDYIGEMKFTRDGNEVWVLNRVTNNITVIDWDTKDIIQNIEVGVTPMDIDFSDDLAVVACYNSNEVYFINLNDYSIAGIEQVAETPAKVHVSKNGNVAVVGCDLPDVGEVFDLNSLTKTQTLSGFTVFLSKFSFITSNPRNSIYYSNFRITDDELYVINGAGDLNLRFFDLSTGAITASINEASQSAQIELSVDGQILIATKTGNPGIVSQINVASQTLIKQISLTDINLYSTYSPPAVGAIGNKAMVTTNPGNNTLIDFDSETWQFISTGISSDWVGRNQAGDLFIAGDFFFSIIDPLNGNIVSSLNGTSIQNGAVGNGQRIVASDPLRYESLVFYDFSNIANILEEDGEANTGSELEADATYSTKFTPDKKKLIAVNSLSGTLSIIDLDSENLEAIIPLGSTETFHVDITSDSRYALVAKRLENEVSIIDLQSNTLVTNVNSGGSKPDQVVVLPGDDYAYAINAGGGDNIGVIALDGANSSFESSFSIGNTGISWTNYGIRSDLKITPDKEYALLATPFDEKVQLIDLASHQVVSDIPIEGFPLQIAVAPDIGLGQFAAVTLKNTNEIAILNGVGNSWTLLGKYPCLDNPVRVAYDELANSFWVTSSDEGKTQRFDIVSLAFEDQNSFSNASPLSVLFAAGDRAFTLLRSNDTGIQAHQVIVSDSFGMETIELPSLPIHHFDLTPDGSFAAIAHPASDEVSLIKNESLVGLEFVPISLKERSFLVYPNPVSTTLNFESTRSAIPTSLEVSLTDAAGKQFFKKQFDQQEKITIQRQDGWSSGIYYFEIRSDGLPIQSGKVIFK